MSNQIVESLRWKKYPVLNDGFICLVDVMGDDAAIVQAARVSYGKDKREQDIEEALQEAGFVAINYYLDWIKGYAYLFYENGTKDIIFEDHDKEDWKILLELDARLHSTTFPKKDRQLIRYLLAHSHTTPFEMMEFKFLVRVPMDCWRQWIRHRTANVNEYSTRYSEAIDSQQTTDPKEWRLQAKDNKQGSSGFLEEWPEGFQWDDDPEGNIIKTHSPGQWLSVQEQHHHEQARQLYQERLALGIAKEQARKDLPLSTYTEAYWKCDLHNIFHFLRLRLDPHAQLEIRLYAQAMAEIVKQVVPVAWEAFEDYVLNAKMFSRMEMECIKNICNRIYPRPEDDKWIRPSDMTDREWKEFLSKLE